MDIQLKPCPFCGSNDVYVFTGFGRIVCTNCKAKFQTDKYMTDEQLSEAWNKRISEALNKRTEPEKNKHGMWLYDEAEGMFYCSECGEKVVYNVYNYCMWCGTIMDGGKINDT